MLSINSGIAGTSLDDARLSWSVDGKAITMELRSSAGPSKTLAWDGNTGRVSNTAVAIPAPCWASKQWLGSYPRLAGDSIVAIDDGRGIGMDERYRVYLVDTVAEQLIAKLPGAVPGDTRDLRDLSRRISATGKYMWLDDAPASVVIASLDRKPLVAHLSHPSPVTALDISADGRYVITIAMDRCVRLWDLPLRKLVQEVGYHGLVAVHVAISPDGTKAASISEDGVILVWSLDPWIAIEFRPVMLYPEDLMGF